MYKYYIGTKSLNIADVDILPMHFYLYINDNYIRIGRDIPTQLGQETKWYIIDVDPTTALVPLSQIFERGSLICF